MSSPYKSEYQILDNRPIDQWKVTELKEELKRRKLITRGLKDELIRRLDEALRMEREAEAEAAKVEDGSKEEDAVNGFESEQSEVPVLDEIAVTNHSENKSEEANDDTGQVSVEDGSQILGHEKDQEGGTTVSVNSSKVDEVLQETMGISDSDKVVENTPVEEVRVSMGSAQADEVVPETTGIFDSAKVVEEVAVVTSVTVTETVVTETTLGDQEDQKNETVIENADPEPPKKDLELEMLDPNSQVSSEVNPVLGFQVKSHSITTDSVSINEKNELSIKDNLIAPDNVKLELDDIKPEMVAPGDGEVHPLGDSHDEQEFENKASIEEDLDDKNIANMDIGKKNDSIDVGSPEKLNLDRSSGDDSMEEDQVESKTQEDQSESKMQEDQSESKIASKYKYDEVVDKNQTIEISVVEEEAHVDIVTDDLHDDKDLHVETKRSPAAPSEKRKLNDQEAVVNEPSKRQRRWNTESVKVPATEDPQQTPSTTPKDKLLNRNFSRTGSTLSEEVPKECVVPPSSKPPTNSLRIDRFLRPFTLKAVQELLGKTGSVSSFWMDHIKTHCYVTYSSVEEAIETRNAVYNLQWPPNGGRLLVAEFVDPQEVKMKLEAPSRTTVTPATTAPPGQPTAQPPQPSPRQQPLRRQQQQQQQPEQLAPPPPPSLPPPPPLTNPIPARERLPLPPPPPLPEKLDPPIVTLDDLFRKTKATPRIYYLPLSEEQVAAKLAARARNATTKQ